MSATSGVSAEDFIKEWQANPDPTVLVKKLGITRQAVYNRVSAYRRRGVPLRQSAATRGLPRDWTALAALARELAPKEEP